MGKRVLRTALCIYFVSIFLISLFCFSLFVIDFVNYKKHDEYRIMPVLNMQKFKISEVTEEIQETITAIGEYEQHLSDIGYTPLTTPLWKLIDSITMLTTLYSLLLYCVLRFFHIPVPRPIKIMILMSFLFSLLQILYVRISFNDTYCETHMGYFYHSAFYWNSDKIPIKVILCTMLVLGAIKVYRILPDNEAE